MKLCNTFGHVEAEAAAALVVGALSVAGDTWRPISREEMRKHRNALSKLPWMMNPFVRPDIDDLVRFATLSDDRKVVELLPDALAVLKASPWNMHGVAG